jgi:hypothetical protein
MTLPSASFTVAVSRPSRPARLSREQRFQTLFLMSATVRVADRARPLHLISVNYPDSPVRFAATTEDAATHFAAMGAIGLRSIKITRL